MLFRLLSQKGVGGFTRSLTPPLTFFPFSTKPLKPRRRQEILEKVEKVIQQLEGGGEAAEEASEE